MITNTSLLFEFPEEALSIGEYLSYTTGGEREDRYSPSMSQGTKVKPPLTSFLN